MYQKLQILFIQPKQYKKPTKSGFHHEFSKLMNNFQPTNASLILYFYSIKGLFLDIKKAWLATLLVTINRLNILLTVLPKSKQNAPYLKLA
ncbi:hypothetical protein CYL31_20620 [Marinomonas sp. A3A]|jgi:hypothetical protein|nr:hypothetical protein CYL31_20620 [Marinomonas sp. A3A]